MHCQMRYPDETKYCFVDGSELVAGKDPRVGTTIAGRYVMEEMIGEGGMATVYRARHKLVDRPCAIKIMNPMLARDPIVRERFRREAKSARKLAHPNIIEIFDEGDTEDGTAYIVMELLCGSSLADVIGDGRIELARALPIMIQIARGIARAHDFEVIHRDLKPENIFICPRENGPDLVKLLDFGIARSRHDSRLTNAGELFGTPQYMAPERITSTDAGPSADLYALGVIFFEMLTGALPFEAPDVTSFLLKHLKEKPASPRALNPLIPPQLDALVLSLLEKEPKARPVDGHRVVHDLVAIAKAAGITVPPEPEDEVRASVRPTPRTLPAAAVNRWSARTKVFEQMLARAYGGRVPGEMSHLLDEIRALVSRVADLRAASVSEQRKLEGIEQRGREGRQRFGFAVDALGIDVSKAKEELRAATARAAELKTENKQAGARFAAVHGEIMVWEGRCGFQEPYTELAAAYRDAAAALDAWLAAADAGRTAAAECQGRERVAGDLDFQIRELRAALATHEKEIEAQRAACEHTIIELNKQAEALESQVLALATKFCEPLRKRPELGHLFQQLEAEAVA